MRIHSLTPCLFIFVGLLMSGCSSVRIDKSSETKLLYKTKDSENTYRYCYTDKKTNSTSCIPYTITTTSVVSEISISRSIDRADCYLIVTGKIDQELSDTANSAIDKLDSMECKNKIVILNSPGGSVSKAMELGRKIRDKKITTLFDSVKADQICASACTLMFIGGFNRVAIKSSIPFLTTGMGFHQWSKSAEDSNCDQTETTLKTLTEYANKMLSSNGASNFIEMTLKTGCNDIANYSPIDLVRQEIATANNL
jgi:uncharacterized protein YceK